MEEWESDNNNPNPFEIREKGDPYTFGTTYTSLTLPLEALTQAGVRLALALQESLSLGSAVAPTVRSHISPSVMITMGLELEEQQ